MPSKKSGKAVKKPAKASAKKRKSVPVAKKAAPKLSRPKIAPKLAKHAAKPDAKRAKPVVLKPVAKPVAAPAPRAKAAAAPAPTPALRAPGLAARPFLKPITPVRLTLGRTMGEEDGDAELSAPANLLAGPRNVKPYIARRGEQYMNKEQLGHFAQILNNWKRDLMVEVDRTVLHMKDEAANFPDPNDRATQEEEFSLELRTRDRERKLIRKIDEALKRIEDGNYGYCLETGEEIGIKRLEARPVATLSVEAQERRERREKQYGDRDDRYR
jgi:RNA polymerase-binding transcription factor